MVLLEGSPPRGFPPSWQSWADVWGVPAMRQHHQLCQRRRGGEEPVPGSPLSPFPSLLMAQIISYTVAPFKNCGQRWVHRERGLHLDWSRGSWPAGEPQPLVQMGWCLRVGALLLPCSCPFSQSAASCDYLIYQHFGLASVANESKISFPSAALTELFLNTRPKRLGFPLIGQLNHLSHLSRTSRFAVWCTEAEMAPGWSRQPLC